MTHKTALQKRERKKIFKASLLKPTNLLVLGVGCLAGKFSAMLIPVGIVAYGVLCYLDLSNEEFVTHVLGPRDMPLGSDLRDSAKAFLAESVPAAQLHTPELQDLRTQILTSKKKIEQLYTTIDEFNRELLGDFSQTEELVKRSDKFLHKAQTIYDYLASEDQEQIQCGITALQEKIQSVEDHFSKQQYQQAYDARMNHFNNVKDIQKIYERLVSQLTNISISLDSLYSRMVKITTTDYAQTNVESEQVSAHLQQMLREMEQLNSAINEHLSLSG